MAKVVKAADTVRLNKYISNAGYCSRRKADELIFAGEVRVNKKIITDPAYRVETNDVVIINKVALKPVRGFVYILINKPKDCIVTASDEKGRKTVFDYVKITGNIRLFSIGRLDRNTTGALILTNDGDLSQKLSHPSGNIAKEYYVTLDRRLSKRDFTLLSEGIELEDGLSVFDQIFFPDERDFSKLILTIHTGKNRIIRRTFESMDYAVKNLDRLSIAGINKQTLNRGEWRHLSEKEITKLKKI